MKLNGRSTNITEKIAQLSLDLLESLNRTGISIEVDEETGVSLVHEMGAFGASPDMPRELAQMYLSDQVASVLNDSPERGY